MTNITTDTSPSDPFLTCEDVEAAIVALPAFERAILLAHRADGLSFAAIAERYGISVRRIEKLLIRSLGRIRRRIERTRKVR